jgi:hypothetical protein
MPFFPFIYKIREQEGGTGLVRGLVPVERRR